MKKLLRIAFSKMTYHGLLATTLLFSLGLSVATTMEYFSLGLVTMKGPDVFELFSTKHSNVLRHEQVEATWKHIDKNNTGIISREELAEFMSSRTQGTVDTYLAKLNKWLPIQTSVWALVAWMVIASLSKAITLFGYRFGTRMFSIHLCRDLRQRYFEHLQSLPMSFYQAHNIGALASRTTTDAYVIADGINSALTNYLQTPFTVISALVLCFAINWKLACVTFVGLPAIIVPIIFIAKQIKRLSRQLQSKQESFSSVLVEFFRGIQTIKLFAMETFSLRKYQEYNHAMAALEMRNARYDTGARPILHIIGMCFLVTALLFGLYRLHMALHEILFFCSALAVVYEPLKKFAEENGRIQRGIAAAERLNEVLDLQPTIHDAPNAHETIHFEKVLSFQNVTFSYEEKPVLEHVSFDIYKGQTVAIVGPTGAGKSTLVALLTRLFEPQTGAICIDGQPLNSFTQKALRDFFAVVPQRPFLFHDTVIENIRYGQPYSEQAVVLAAQQAHAEEFILQLPHQYQTFLAEAGKSLSGGQQQRIALARALIKQAPVLILDEATSSLDSMSEFHIKSTLRELKGSMTQIIIAHRLSTIQDADRIIVIESGKKVGDGTKDELLTSCPAFQKLWHPHASATRTL